MTIAQQQLLQLNICATQLVREWRDGEAPRLVRSRELAEYYRKELELIKNPIDGLDGEGI